MQVTIRVRDGKKITHEGIKVEFVGSIGATITRKSPQFNLTFRSSQNYSTTGDTTMNSSRYLKNLQHLVRCDKRRHSNLRSRMWRSSMKAIKGLM